MRDRDAAVGTGLVRLAAGTGLLRFPRPLIRLSGGAPDDRRLRALFGYFGCRDIALGVTAVAAARPGGSARRQLWWQCAADAGDAVILVAMTRMGAFPRLRGTALAGVAAATAVADAVLASHLGDDG